MKLVFFALFIFGASLFTYAMEGPNAVNFFPPEGKNFTGHELLQKYGAWHTGYDTDEKFNDFSHHPALHEKYGNLIIRKKLGDPVSDFVRSQQNHEWSAPIIRYTKAVTFRLSTICTIDASNEQLIEAEGQVPYNYREHFYITLGDRTNLALYEEEDIPSAQALRKRLSDFLNKLKVNIEIKK